MLKTYQESEPIKNPAYPAHKSMSRFNLSKEV